MLTLAAIALSFASPVHVVLALFAILFFILAAFGVPNSLGGWVPIGLIFLALCFVFV